MSREQDVQRIATALEAAAHAIKPFTPGDIEFNEKAVRGDPVTAADLAADAVLRDILPQRGEGWLSEESADHPSRLTCRRVWIVDPIDGTREFIKGIPEWCISIGLLEDGEPVAGGILNPATEELILGSVEGGVTYNGTSSRVLDPGLDAPMTVLASRSEIRRGEWERFATESFSVKPCGSVAYKMALVAGGQFEATWTLVPKSEWDVAAGVALVRGAGGAVLLADGSIPRFNKPEPKFPHFIAAGRRTAEALIRDRLGLAR